MSDQFWYLLYNEINSEIIIENGAFIMSEDVTDKIVPIFDYDKYIHNLTSHFIGECRNNMEEKGETPSFFNDLLWKLNHYFELNFGIDFLENKIKYPLIFRNKITIPEISDDSDLVVHILKLRISAVEMCIDFISRCLAEKSKNIITRRNRKSASINRIKSNISPKQLCEILKVGKRLKFISLETDQRIFIDIFTGASSNGQIDWIGTVYSLNKFINSINGYYIDKLTDRKWEIISNLFLVNGKSVSESGLKHPGKGKNDRIEDLDKLISNFSELD